MPELVQWHKPTSEDIEQAQRVLGAVPEGELLKFSNAVLMRAECNKNFDEIDEAGVGEVASTIALMPIDDEHDEKRLMGFFVGGRAEGGACLTDGVLYARRFPEETRDVMSGKKRLSVEAYAERAVCSVCGEEFLGSTPYCEHLRNRPKSGAVRKLYGLKAVGGAITETPAGTDTEFDTRNGFMLMASLQPAQNETNLVTLEADLAASTEQAQREEDMKLEELQALLEEVKTKLAAKESEAETLSARVTALQGEVETLKASEETAKQNLESARVNAERSLELVALGMPLAEVQKMSASLASTPDSVFEVLKASIKVENTVSEPEPSVPQKPRVQATVLADSGTDIELDAFRVFEG